MTKNIVFFFIFLRKKLYLAKKTWVKHDFCCRDKNYFVRFSEEKNDISQKSPKYRKAEPEPEKNMRKKFSVSSYPSVKNGFAKNRVFLSEGVNFHAGGGCHPPPCEVSYCPGPLMKVLTFSAFSFSNFCIRSLMIF